MPTLEARGEPELAMRPLLREATRALHEQIETVWAPAGAFESEKAYRSFLSTLMRIHRQVGLTAAMARGDTEEVDEEQRRLSALAADLDASPAGARPARTLGADYAWGVGYVLNGSCLGAAMLLKSGGLGPEWPRRYLYLGRDFAKSGRLRRYFERLNALPLDREAVERGALETFGMFKDSGAEAEDIGR
ncbi:MAG: biliverdin-producing heme oxygenase [Pseudomonadota bacterium]